MKSVLMIGCFLLAGAFAKAQDEACKVNFVVHNKQTHRPVWGMEIAIMDSANHYLFAALTDSNGRVCIGLPLGQRFYAFAKSPSLDIAFYDTQVDTFVTDSGVKDIAFEATPFDFIACPFAPGVYFSKGSVWIYPYSKEELDGFISYMSRQEPCSVAIVGHTDTGGDEKENYKLSLERAATVKAHLDSFHSQHYFYIMGKGSAYPIHTCKNRMKCTPEEHQLNDRVTVWAFKRLIY